jgi:hypothetical protein
MGQVDTIASPSPPLSLLLVKLVNVSDANVRESRQLASAHLPWDKNKRVKSVPPQRTPNYLHMDIPVLQEFLLQSTYLFNINAGSV